MYPPRTYPWHSWGRNDPLALENPIPPDPSVSETIPSVNRDRDLCSPRCARPCIPRAYRRADRNEPSSPPQFYSIDNPRNYNPPPAPFLCRSRSGPRPPPAFGNGDTFAVLTGSGDHLIVNATIQFHCRIGMFRIVKVCA